MHISRNLSEDMKVWASETRDRILASSLSDEEKRRSRDRLKETLNLGYAVLGVVPNDFEGSEEYIASTGLTIIHARPLIQPEIKRSQAYNEEV